MQNVDRPTGSSLAGAAILLEIGAAYGIVDFIRHSNGFDVAALAERSGIGEPMIADYVDAMREAGLVTLAKAGERTSTGRPTIFPTSSTMSATCRGRCSHARR